MTLLTEIPNNKNQLPVWIQLNLSTTATFGTEESNRCKEVVIVERFQTRVSVRIFCPPGPKKVVVVERWLLAEVQLHFLRRLVHFTQYTVSIFFFSNSIQVHNDKTNTIDCSEVWIKPNFHRMQQDFSLNVTKISGDTWPQETSGVQYLESIIKILHLYFSRSWIGWVHFGILDWWSLMKCSRTQRFDSIYLMLKTTTSSLYVELFSRNTKCLGALTNCSLKCLIFS